MGERAGDAEPIRDMAVVAAGMHLAFGVRSEARDERLMLGV